MRLYVAITDGDWFTYLLAAAPLDEVNFWQPSAGRQFRRLQAGEPFLFKLHSPRNYIVGGGFFSYFTILPVSFAWSTFTTKNGAQSEQEMRTRIARYRKAPSSPAEDYEIGCILLQAPFFFRETDWVPISDWSREIVQGRTFEIGDDTGQQIWQQVEERLQVQQTVRTPALEGLGTEQRFGAPQLVLSRLGQGSFRVVVTDAYKRRCAFTGSPVLHVLDAAHIKPYSEGGPHAASNGILLRQDVHTLFDRGYITVTRDYRVEVSHRIKEEFENGHEYYAVHGKSIALPDSSDLRPARDFLSWHNEHVFLG